MKIRKPHSASIKHCSYLPITEQRHILFRVFIVSHSVLLNKLVSNGTKFVWLLWVPSIPVKGLTNKAKWIANGRKQIQIPEKSWISQFKFLRVLYFKQVKKFIGFLEIKFPFTFVLVWENTQHAFRDAREMKSEERRAPIPYWWHATIQIWVVLPIGPATRKICFNQSKALSRSG